MRRELTALSPRKLCAAGVAGALRQNRVSKKKVSLSLSHWGEGQYIGDCILLITSRKYMELLITDLLN